MRSLFSGQQQLPDASSGAKAGAAQSVGAQQHVLFPVGEEREREQEKEPTLTIGTAPSQVH
jgi:hypothetical protein